MDADDKVIDIKAPRKRMPTADKPSLADTPLIMETWPIERFVAYPKNPRKLDEGVIERMVRNIREFGFRIPICAKSTNNEVVDGHLRLAAARKLGITHLPVALADNLSDVQIKAFRLAANRSANWAEWDNDLLKIELSDIKSMGFDIEMTGFSDEEIGKIGGEWKTINDVPDELPGAKALKTDMLFPKDGPYGLPALLDRKESLGRLPKQTLVWAGEKWWVPEKERALLVFGKGNLTKLPRDRTSVCFFTHDFEFECVWNDAAKYTAKFINMDVHEVIEPDFSRYGDHPRAVWIYNCYRSRWLGRYFQEAGLRVVPNLMITSHDMLDVTMPGIPRNCPQLAVEMHMEVRPEDRELWRELLRIALHEIKPQSLLVYGGASAPLTLKGLDLPELVYVRSFSNRWNMGKLRGAAEIGLEEDL